jgi:hypothetical protein
VPKILNSSLNALISVMLGSAGMLLIGLCAPPSASCQQSAPTAPDLSLALTAPNDVLRGGSPVEVNFVVKNITDHNVEYSCFVLIPCGLQVHDANGDEPPDAQLHRRFRPGLARSPNISPQEIPMGRLGVGVLKPGEVQTNVIDVDKWYDLSRPGIYTVQVIRATKAGEVWQRSNAITIQVVPAEASRTAPAPGPPFSLIVRTYGKYSTVTSREPGFGLLVDTKNTSAHRITLATQKPDQEQVGPVYKIDVLDSAGASAPEKDAGRLAKIRDQSPPFAGQEAAQRHGEEALSLKPGEEWWDAISVSQFYDLSKPGQYTIQLRRWDDETKTWVKSNTITLTVTP